jgi:hypothetical protein
MDNGLPAAAEALARLGYRIFPLRDRAKRPRIKRWPELATTDIATVGRWWLRWPRSNIGIATGDDLAVIDVDPSHGGAIDPAWPDTTTVSTPSAGWHLYYACANVRNSVGRLGPGVDVRGERGYVAAPPSVTERGEYEWAYVPDSGIARVSPSMFDVPGPGRGHRQERGNTSPRRFIQRDRVGEGERNSYLASYAGWLFANGYSFSEVVQCVELENASVCLPPLPPDEPPAIAESIARYHYARPAGSAAA